MCNSHQVVAWFSLDCQHNSCDLKELFVISIYSISWSDYNQVERSQWKLSDEYQISDVLEILTDRSYWRKWLLIGFFPRKKLKAPPQKKHTSEGLFLGWEASLMFFSGILSHERNKLAKEMKLVFFSQLYLQISHNHSWLNTIPPLKWTRRLAPCSPFVPLNFQNGHSGETREKSSLGISQQIKRQDVVHLDETFIY